MNGKRPGGWIALAHRAFRDPKVRSVSPAAKLLWLAGLCDSGEQETDGLVGPLDALLALADPEIKRPANVARSLVKAGLWVETAEGFAVPFETWNRWQETAEQRAAARVREAERKAKWRASRVAKTSRPVGQDVGQAKCPTASGVGAGVGHSPTTPAPHAEREDHEPEGPTPLGWEEFTDAAGNLYVRTVANGQADPNPELEP